MTSFHASLNREPRPRLIPAHVPWQVTGKAAKLGLVTAETSLIQPTHILFYAAVLPNAEGENFENQIIRVTFDDAVCARLTRGESGGMPHNVLVYDTSAIAADEDVKDDLGKIVKRMDDKWRRTGICPDPGFYEMRPSPWLPEFPDLDDENLHHYLASGYWASVEVLARGWKWATVRDATDEVDSFEFT